MCVFVHSNRGSGQQTLNRRPQIAKSSFLSTSLALICINHTHTHTQTPTVHTHRGISPSSWSSVRNNQGDCWIDLQTKSWQPTEKRWKKGWGCGGWWIAKDRQEEEERERKKSRRIQLKNSQWGKSLKYCLKKPAVETSTHPNEAESSKQSLTSNSASAQLLAVASSGPTGK